MSGLRTSNAPCSTTSLAAGWRWGLASVLVVVTLNGCAAFHPVRGVPAPLVPPEYLGPSRSGKKTIDLSLLVQTQPDEYRVAARDVLSIYIPGVLGVLNVSEDRQIGETPPINISSNPHDPPTIGYPVTVRGNGTIALPYVPPINVHGMTVPEIEVALRQAFSEHAGVLKGEQDRVLVSLQRRREYSVLVVRQETSSELTQGGQPGTLNIGNSKRGTAKTVRLPAYENDVLHALASSEQGANGLPGLDAKNTIYIIRRKKARPAPAFRGIRPSLPSSGVPQSSAPHFAPNPVRRSDLNSSPQVLPAQRTPLQSIPTRQQPPVRNVGPQVIEQQSPPPPPVTPLAPIPAAPETIPPPNAETLLPQPHGRPRNDAVPEAAEPAPIWPGPANPPSSIRRTSGESGPTRAPAEWPTIRGQSPYRGWNWGHSSRPPVNGQPFAHQGQSQIPQSPLMMQASHTIGYASPADPHPLASVGGHDNSWQGALSGFDPTVDNPNVIKIPIRLAEGEYPTFTERDIILDDGDIVFIESRETEVFYTGGLLGGGQFTLPRDYDLRVLEAISIAQSQNNTQSRGGRSIGGVSALNQDVTISASHVAILRSLPNGTRIPIEVDLYKALRRPQENILVQPGDLVILQYTKVEAVAAFIERHLLEGAMFGVAATYFNRFGGSGN